jgi:hypothetical protein
MKKRLVAVIVLATNFNWQLLSGESAEVSRLPFVIRQWTEHGETYIFLIKSSLTDSIDGGKIQATAWNICSCFV